MRDFKVFIQAVRGEGAEREERMFRYDEMAPDADAARTSAKAKFELEWAAKGWHAESGGVLEM
ncbi:hypothetical protein M7784_06405 [Desulfovibrio aminophilus]|nr:hypothetical protein [Desulfovibrio aminophilus]MCM0754876.1 hypothetical protein [Desulfovibrio aminophilus]